jgi:hypothetical protein
VEEIPDECPDDQKNEHREQQSFSRVFVLVFQNSSDVTTPRRAIVEVNGIQNATMGSGESLMGADVSSFGEMQPWEIRCVTNRLEVLRSCLNTCSSLTTTRSFERS